MLSNCKKSLEVKLLNVNFQKILSVVVIALIAFGLFLFTYKSTSFNLFGFILVMAASAVGGLRWVLAQILLQRDSLGIVFARLNLHVAT